MLRARPVRLMNLKIQKWRSLGRRDWGGRLLDGAAESFCCDEGKFQGHNVRTIARSLTAALV
eukprot:1502908-Pleurochrysis_carterae.AAC.1